MPLVSKPCQKQVLSTRRLIGAFVPKCKPDGTYEEKQCHGSTGHCWCVNAKSGREIPNTRKGPGKGKVTCGMWYYCVFDDDEELNQTYKLFDAFLFF